MNAGGGVVRGRSPHHITASTAPKYEAVMSNTQEPAPVAWDVFPAVGWMDKTDLADTTGLVAAVK